MEGVEDIVIVGGGIAGLTTSLGLHRLGIRSLVLESSDFMRNTGFPITAYTNAWKALDAVGIGDSIRQHHQRLQGNVITSTITGLQTSQATFAKIKAKHGGHEIRCVHRNLLLETLAKELPSGTIRYSSKVVSVEESSFYKLIHLADGTILKTKVLIGCDGVNSVVAKWLQFKKPAISRRSAIRGCVDFMSGHSFGDRFKLFFGRGFRSGYLPCDDNTVYWFLSWAHSSQENAEKEREMGNDPTKMKQFVLDKLGKIPDEVRAVIQNNELDRIILSPLRYRHPWELMWGNISKGNVCVAGDAFHPMTPEIGQGGCAALEDGVVLARCLGEALLKEPIGATKERAERERQKYKQIEAALKKYAEERKWRSIQLITTAYIVGYIQQGHGMFVDFLRDKILARYVPKLVMKMADFDCGKLN